MTALPAAHPSNYRIINPEYLKRVQENLEQHGFSRRIFACDVEPLRTAYRHDHKPQVAAIGMMRARVNHNLL